MPKIVDQPHLFSESLGRRSASHHRLEGLHLDRVHILCKFRDLQGAICVFGKVEEYKDLLWRRAGWEGEGGVRLSIKVVLDEPTNELLEIRSTYLDNDEQGVFNDVDEVQL